MGEQRIGIIGGTDSFVAVRDAYDETPGARRVERIDFASDHLPSTYIGSPYRTNVATTGVGDGTDATSFGTASGTLVMGDKSAVVFNSVTYSNTGQVTVVPLFYDSAMSLMFVGDEMTLVAGAMRRGTENGSPYVTPARMVDSFGASYMRFMVKSCVGTVNIHAGVI